MLMVGERIRAIREEKGLSQGDIEAKTKMLRCYISRIENQHTVPSLDTLQKFAQALDIPLYQLFYDGDNAKMLPVVKSAGRDRTSLKEQREIETIGRQFLKLRERDRGLVRAMMSKLARTA